MDDIITFDFGRFFFLIVVRIGSIRTTVENTSREDLLAFLLSPRP